MAATPLSLSMLWACVFMSWSPAPGVAHVRQGEPRAPGDSGMAETQVSHDMLCASLLALGDEAHVL